MKKLLYLIPITFLFIAISCNDGNHLDPKEAAKSWPLSEIMDTVPQVQKITPVKIGLTKPDNTKTPYPQCDGGECENFTFTIGVQIPDAETQNLEYRADTYAVEKGQAAKNPSLLRAKEVYKILSTAKMDELEIHVFKGKIQQIWRKEQWGAGKDGKDYIPADCLWTKKPLDNR